MWSKWVFALALFGFVGMRPAHADTELQRIADALDVSKIKTFQFTGNGKIFAVGQSTSPMAAWPRYYGKSMTRVYDFTAGAMRDDLVRTQGEAPPSGGGGQPLAGDQRLVLVVHGDHAWNEVAKAWRTGVKGVLMP